MTCIQVPGYLRSECLHCHLTGWIHTDDDVPDQMCPYCFVGKAVIKIYEKATKVLLGRHEELLKAEKQRDALLIAMDTIQAVFEANKAKRKASKENYIWLLHIDISDQQNYNNAVKKYGKDFADEVVRNELQMYADNLDCFDANAEYEYMQVYLQTKESGKHQPKEN